MPEAGGVVVELLLPELLLPEVLLDGAVVLVPEEDGAAVLEAGGVAAGAACCSDGCLAQAVRSTAAASALRTTFVFIDSTPVN
ncbi:MAG: hypothetical protein ACP5PN_02640 [Steroidobacteraceae bacterium]